MKKTKLQQNSFPHKDMLRKTPDFQLSIPIQKMQPEACGVLGERGYNFSFPLVQIQPNIVSAPFTDILHCPDSFPDLLGMLGCGNSWTLTS